jgi:hypothetical protein
MQAGDKNKYKYVFVCGMARSGTSMLGRNVARLADCTGFRNTGVFEDEGQFLQDVYAVASEYGGSSRCGFDPRAHRTETSGLLTPQNIERLRASWHAHWDSSRSICVEKTPENLLMTRFLQAAFPNSYFIVMRRHPVPVSMAGQKWKVNVTSLHMMFEHWLRCYEVFEEDKKYLKNVYELAYEDYLQNPAKYHQEIAAFIGTHVPEPPSEDKFYYILQWRSPSLRVPEAAMEEVSEAHNKKYFERWRNLLTNSLFRKYYRYIAAKYDSRFAKYGYSLLKGLGLEEEVLEAGGKMSALLGALSCVAADTGAFIWRIAIRSKQQLRVTSKAVLPQVVVEKIRHTREKSS